MIAWIIGVVAIMSCTPSQNDRHQNFIIQTIIRNVEAERQGRPHNTSHRNWNDYWVWSISCIRKAPDADRYENMVIEMRRSAGLPELK